MGNSNGKSTVKSAWNELRQKQAKIQIFDYKWTKGLPIKINAFLWRGFFKDTWGIVGQDITTFTLSLIQFKHYQFTLNLVQLCKCYHGLG